MKVEFTAILKQIGAIEVMKHGFRQNNIFNIPELKDEFETVKRKEQFFVVQIYSTKQTDSRFLTSVEVGKRKVVSAYLNGERYMQEGKFDFTYLMRLNLIDLKEPNNQQRTTNNQTTP